MCVRLAGDSFLVPGWMVTEGWMDIVLKQESIDV